MSNETNEENEPVRCELNETELNFHQKKRKKNETKVNNVHHGTL